MSELKRHSSASDDPQKPRELEVAPIDAAPGGPVNRAALIDAVEALAVAIRRKVDPDRPALPTFPTDFPSEMTVAGGSAVSLRELEPLVDAVEAELREIRQELGLVRTGALELGMGSLGEHPVADPGRAPDRELGPLIDAFAAQIRGIRGELGLSSEPVVETPEPTAAVVSLRPVAPDLVRTVAADRREERSPGHLSTKPGHVSRPRWPWLVATIGILLLVAAGVGVLRTSDRRLPTTEADRPPMEIPSISPDRSMPSQTPAPEPAAGSDPGATASAAPPVLVPSDSTVTSRRRRVSPAVAGANATVPDPAGRPSDVVPDAGAATPSPPAPELSRPAPGPPVAGATGPDVRPSGAPLPGRDDVAATIPTVPAAESAAPPETSGNSSSSLTRPAAVVARGEPRTRLDLLSGEVSAVIEVEVSVDRTGAPIRVRAVSGPAALRTQAEDIVGHWTFSPALQGGEPVDSALRVSLRFGPPVRDMRFGRRPR